MSSLLVNGQNLNGEIFKLKQGISIEAARKLSQNDGQDQVFFSANGENYFVQDDKLDISSIKKDFNNGKLPQGVFVGQSDTKFNANIQAIDDEKNGFLDGAWNLGTKISAGVAVGGGAIAGIGALAVSTGSITGAFLGSAAMIIGGYTGGAGVVGAAASALTGGTIAAFNQPEDNTTSIRESLLIK